MNNPVKPVYITLVMSIAIMLGLLAGILTGKVEAAPVYSSSYLVYDKGYSPIQGFAPIPAKAQVPATVNAGATQAVTVTGWTAISFRATADVQVYLNADTTKFMTFNGLERHVLVVGPGVTTFNFKNASGAVLTLEIWGM